MATAPFWWNFISSFVKPAQEEEERKETSPIEAATGRSDIFDKLFDGNNKLSEDEPRNGTLGGGEERQTTVQLEAQNRLKKLNDMMTRATQIINMKSTLIDRTSNINKDFDYLFLRRVDNTRFFKQVQTILNQYYEDNQIAVFSEIV